MSASFILLSSKMRAAMTMNNYDNPDVFLHEGYFFYFCSISDRLAFLYAKVSTKLLKLKFTS